MKLTSLPKKFITCFVAGLTTIPLILMLGNSGTLDWFPPVVVFSLVGIVFSISVFYPVAWQYRERSHPVNSGKV